MNIKKLIRNNEYLLIIASYIYQILLFYSIRGRRSVKFTAKGAFIKNITINCKGNNNKVVFEKGCRLSNCSITILGNNTKLHIKEDCVINGLDIWLQDDESSILIGKNTWISKNCHLACIEGTKIVIGERCLFSSDITFRTGDSHSILNAENIRINKSKDIIIGSKVWIGNKVILLKGSMIGNDCVVGTGSVVSGKVFENNTLIAGVPAKIIKTDIHWDSENI